MIGVLTFIITLLILVLVHEFGHFGAARWFGVAVDEFGSGFPPAIFKKRLGQTVYSFNWIPLGGFVRIRGEERTVVGPDSVSSLIYSHIFAIMPIPNLIWLLSAT